MDTGSREEDASKTTTWSFGSDRIRTGALDNPPRIVVIPGVVSSTPGRQWTVRDVRRLGCGRTRPRAIRFHDVISHRVSRVLDRACELPRGAGSAVARHQARGLYQPVQ